MPKKPIRHPFFSQEHDAWAVPLTQGVIALVDEDVVKLLGAKNWYAQIISRSWYATRHVDWRREIKIMMHTEILGTRRGYEIDHRINYPLDRLLIDNRRSNLRHCTRLKNSGNQRRKSNAIHRYKGTSWNAERHKWEASIMLNYRRIFLGRFTDPLVAALAYDDAARRFHGEFALTNASLGLLPNADVTPAKCQGIET